MPMAQTHLWADTTFLSCISETRCGEEKKKKKTKNSQEWQGQLISQPYYIIWSQLSDCLPPLNGQLINTQPGSAQWGYKEAIILTMGRDKKVG